MVNERQEVLTHFCFYVFAARLIEPCDVPLTVSAWLRCFEVCLCSGMGGGGGGGGRKAP